MHMVGGNVFYLKNKVKIKYLAGARRSSNAYARSGPPTSKYTFIEIHITLLVRSSFPTSQNGRQSNEYLPNWGYPPRPRYKVTRRLGGETCNQKTIAQRSQVSLQPARD